MNDRALRSDAIVKMINSTAHPAAVEDFYTFFKANSLLALTLMTWVLVQVGGNGLILILKDLKSNDNKIPLHGLLLKNTNSAQIIYNLVNVNLDLYRIWIGPLPFAVCTI